MGKKMYYGHFDVLTDRERLALSYRLQNETLAEIGARLKVSKERARQMVAKAEGKIRRYWDEELLPVHNRTILKNLGIDEPWNL